MKAAFIDPQLRVLYYPAYDVIVCSGDQSVNEDEENLDSME